jgi:hypothetical protein
MTAFRSVGLLDQNVPPNGEGAPSLTLRALLFLQHLAGMNGAPNVSEGACLGREALLQSPGLLGWVRHDILDKFAVIIRSRAAGPGLLF